MQPDSRDPSPQQLHSLVHAAERASPPSPHRLFVLKLIQLCYESTGAVYSELWYRKLIASAGSKRRPSARTVNLAVVSFKESKGLAAGPTQVAVKELRSQYGGMADLVARIEKAVDRLASIADRQLQISQSLDRRQQLFADQSQTYQRQIDTLAEIVKSQSLAAREASKSASEIALQASRALRDIQTAVSRPPG